MKHRSITLVGAAAAAAAAFVLLGGVATASSAPVVTVVMTKAGPTIAGPTTWHPGLARIAVRSRVADEEVALLHFRSGYSYARFLADGVKAQGHTAAARTAVQRIFANTIFDGGVDLFPGQSATFAVPVRAGTYYLGEMTTSPQLTVIHVRGAAKSPTAPSAAVVTATDSGYRIGQGPLPTQGTITVRNTGSRPHRLNLIPVKAGTTRAQLGYALPAGTYALIDFDQDMRSGRPESLEGMYAVTTLR